MTTPIRFKTSDDKEYVLEFSRKTVSDAELAGFNLDELTTKPMTRISELFHYAFKMHQPWITKKETDRILAEEFHGLKEDELVHLAELYSAPFESMVFSEGDEKNVRRVTIL